MMSSITVASAAKKKRNTAISHISTERKMMGKSNGFLWLIFAMLLTYSLLITGFIVADKLRG